MAGQPIGLALALDVWGKSGDIAGRWTEVGAGVLRAIGASVAFATALILITRRLGGMDGRLRSFLFMSVVAVLGLAWAVLGQAVAPLQIVGAFIVVGAIAWMGAGKR